jgi:predicted Zn-dependent peptidase
MRRGHVLLLPFIALCLGLPATAQVRKADELKYPPLAEFKVPQPQRVVLDNGLVLLILEDHELPLVNASVRVRTGARWEPADKVGLASLCGSVLRTGGTKNMKGDELDEYLESKAAVIETGIGTEAGTASLSCLKQDFPEVLKVLAEVLRNPVFDEDKLKIAKNLRIAAIARQNDNPQGIMFREFNEIVYGESSPYARVTTYATIDAITRQDLVDWHARYFYPERTIIGLVGDFDSAQAIALVRQVLGDWRKGGSSLTEPEVAYRKETPKGVYFIEKADMNQSNIIMGHLGIVRNNPDYYAVEVLNQVLSGSFASRLFSNVRSVKGLAYAVAGGIGSEWDHPGAFNMWTTTKVESTGKAVDALLEEARNLTAKPPTAEEVNKAKGSILNSFVFNSDSMGEILGQQLTYEYYGYPLDWLSRYQKGIEQVTVEQVKAAAKKYVFPDNFAILVTGPGKGLDKPLETYGAVTKVDITIPEPPAPKQAAVTAEGMQQGTALIAKAVEALGGAAVVDGLRSIEEKASVTAKMPQGEFTARTSTLLVFPDRFRQEVILPVGTMTTVMTPADAFLKTPAGVRPVPDSMKREIQKLVHRIPLALLRLRGEAGFKAAVVGREEIDSKQTAQVQVEYNGDVSTLSIDPETGRIVRLKYRGANMTGVAGEMVRNYSDFRQAGSVTVPFAWKETFNGEPSMSGVVEGVAVNVPIDETLFAKPSQ